MHAPSRTAESAPVHAEALRPGTDGADARGHASAVVLVPAFDESASVGDLVRALRGLPHPPRVLVIDDGSSDGTARRAAEAGADVVRHVRRRGNGAAVKSGLAASDEDLVVVLDADGQHDPRHVPALLAALADGADLAVAARADFADSGRMRGLGNHILAAWASYVTGAAVPDLTSGFRAFRRGTMAPYVPLFPDGFSTPTTSTLAMLHAGRRVRFLTVPGRARGDGRTRTRVLRDGPRLLAVACKVALLFRPARAAWPPLAAAVLALGTAFAGGGTGGVAVALVSPCLACLLAGRLRLRAARVASRRGV